MKKIYFGKTFEETMEDINGVGRCGDRCLSDKECYGEPFLSDLFFVNFEKCSLQNISIYRWCDETAKYFFCLYHDPEPSPSRPISVFQELFKVGIEKFEAANSNLEEIISKLNKSVDQLNKLHVRSYSEYYVVNEYYDVNDESFSPTTQEKTESIKEFNELSSRIGSAVVDIENRKMNFSHEFEINTELLSQLKKSFTSLEMMTHWSNHQELCINIFAACEDYLMKHGVARPLGKCSYQHFDFQSAHFHPQ